MPDNTGFITAEKIEQIRQQIQAGAQLENPKIELKREFWDIDTEKGKEEFAKDLTCMANSSYGAGDIIVGIDGGTGELIHTVLPLDAADLANIISRKVLEPFSVEFIDIEVNGINIVAVHVPRSYNKPHMLRSFRQWHNYIPVRDGTRTRPANKFDLDLMYAEREKDITPPYRLEPFVIGNPLKITVEPYQTNYWTCNTHILNTGSRINLLTGGWLTLYQHDEEITTFRLRSWYIPKQSEDTEFLSNENFMPVNPNDAAKVILGFKHRYKEPGVPLPLDRFDEYYVQIGIKDITGAVTFTDKVHAFSTQS
ncbi:helix-turn-helix domain-containing protein [Brevibacillus brevis]|uniref:AlbA family DNA-binding domain-containing protein n=1 Tax=Brevibacillus brevis TaxID=1393 RepID=UPI001C8EAFDC|nr:ATP-binding protein [Brevibacillus brevis]MBY0088416.1 ATP-binding protein [Brevibacillus brevis]